jgi:hypothetical protein
MQRFQPFGAFGALILAIAAARVGPAAAETIRCTAITAAPYTITSPGKYCLTREIATTMTGGAAITIDADDVVLDLNAHTLDGRGAGTSTLASGVYALQRRNITIRNGTIEGFERGIVLDDASLAASRDHLIENIRLCDCTLAGIDAHGSNVIVRNNEVLRTGGMTGPAWDVEAYGIYVAGPSARVVGNDVHVVTPTGLAWSYGIFLNAAPNALAVGNRITQADLGLLIEPRAGSAKYRDNLTSGVTTPFAGLGTDAGNNN